MEAYRVIVYLSITIALCATSFLYSYEAPSTHPGLTSEILKLYEVKHGDTFTKKETDIIIESSIAEDFGGRFFNHFYDPIHNVGLFFGYRFPTSKIWAQNSWSQASFVDPVNTVGRYLWNSKYGASGDYSWNTAIYEYVYGDTHRALQSLGHTLHLVEDLTVPDHVRNDPHPNVHAPFVGDDVLGEASYYEVYTNQFNHDNMSVAFDVFNTGKSIPRYDSLDEYFDTLALFTNTHFFSRDTLPDTHEYVLPKVEGVTREYKDDQYYLINYLNNQKLYLILVDEIVDVEKNKINKIYNINDDDKKVMSSYWNILSKEAVVNGAGVLELFFREVEKERNTGKLKRENTIPIVEVANTVAQYATDTAIVVKDDAVDTYKSATSLLSSLYTSSLSFVGQKYTSVSSWISSSNNQTGIAYSLQLEKVPEDTGQNQTPESVVQNTSSTDAMRDVVAKIAQAQESVVNLQNAIALLQSQAQQPQSPPIVEVAQVRAPELRIFPAIVTGSPNTQSVDTGIPDTSEQATDTEIDTPDPIEHTASSTPAIVYAELGNVSADICSESIGVEDCVVFPFATSTLSYTVSSDNYVYVEITVNGTAATTTEHSFVLSGINEGAIDISLRLYYSDATYSDTETFSIYSTEKPVVLSEIGWAGTQHSSFDEYIELYNRTGYDIALDGWNIISDDDTPAVALLGSISAQSYFLLERTDDTTIPDYTADMLYTGSLSNNGEVLSLSFASTTIDSSPEITDGRWAFGDSDRFCSMERYVDEDGSVNESWADALVEISPQRDIDDALICGSPGERNTIEYLINKGLPIESDITLDTNRVYVVLGGQIISPDATLTISAGDSIKLYDTNSGFIIYGNLAVDGRSGSPAVITSFADGGLSPTSGMDFANASQYGGFIYIVQPDAWFGGEYLTLRPLYEDMINYGTIDLSHITYEDGGRAPINSFGGSVTLSDVSYIPYDSSAGFVWLFDDAIGTLSGIVSTADIVDQYMIYTFNTSHASVSDSTFGDMYDAEIIQSFGTSDISLESITVGDISGKPLFEVFNSSTCSMSTLQVGVLYDEPLFYLYHSTDSTLSGVTIASLFSNEYAFYTFNESTAVIDGLSITDIANGMVGVVAGNSDVTVQNAAFANGLGHAFFVSGNSVYTPKLTLDGVTLDSFWDSAIYARSADIAIRNSVIQNSLNGLYVISNGNSAVETTVSQSVIQNNLNAGIVNDIDSPVDSVDARNTFWGDMTGPYSETANTEGLGDSVEGDVVFDPWLEESPL